MRSWNVSNQSRVISEIFRAHHLGGHSASRCDFSGRSYLITPRFKVSISVAWLTIAYTDGNLATANGRSHGFSGSGIT